MSKVNFFDKRILSTYWGWFSIISAIISFIFLFDFIPENCKSCNLWIGIICIIILCIIYFVIWLRANRIKKVDITIDGSQIIIKEGDIFTEPGLKVIAFNEYFDTVVDNKIIAEKSLNGVFINKFYKDNPSHLDSLIDKQCDKGDIIEENVNRKLGGKTTKYRLSSTLVINEFILTALSSFDDNNNAYLTMQEYIVFLINFWKRINRIYAQQDVSLPLLGSGITRIKEHINITDDELLKIMLWTFKLSKCRFKHPAKITIVIHKDKIDKINFYDIQTIGKGMLK